MAALGAYFDVKYQVASFFIFRVSLAFDPELAAIREFLWYVNHQ